VDRNRDIGLVAVIPALAIKVGAIEASEAGRKIHEIDKVIYGDVRGELAFWRGCAISRSCTAVSRSGST